MKRTSWLVLSLLTSLLIACNAAKAATTAPITRLAHYQVVDLQGNTIAQVEDVLIDADSGQISYAFVILERGPFSYGKAAFIDASISRTAMPWGYFSLDSGAEQLRLQVDRAILYAAPRLMNEPEHLETGWDAAIQTYWQVYPVPITQE